MELATDLNNNSPEEKSYSLRPRTSLRTHPRDCSPQEAEEIWRPRGRSRRRAKQKSAPLSKYRRKTANARERSRMREINEAFEALRRAVPHLHPGVESPQERTSKIMTLRLAMKYITALTVALREPGLGESPPTLGDVVLTFDGNVTPGSTSEQSEFADDFFAQTLPSESLSSTSPSYDLPGLITPPLSESTHLPPFNLLRPELLQPLPSAPARTLSLSPSMFMSHCDIRSHTLTPPEDLPRGFNSYTFKENFLPSSSFLSTDFDGLPSPSMDLDDLLIK